MCQFYLDCIAWPHVCWISFSIQLFAGSTLVSFQFLQSSFIVSLHVFLGLPRPGCPSTSSAVMLLTQPSFLAIWTKQCNQLYCNNVCMLLIPSFSRRESELMWSFKRTLHIHRTIAQSLHSNFSMPLILGAQHSLAHNKTGWIYVLYVCPRVVHKRAHVSIGKSSKTCPMQIAHLW